MCILSKSVPHRAFLSLQQMQDDGPDPFAEESAAPAAAAAEEDELSLDLNSKKKKKKKKVGFWSH